MTDLNLPDSVLIIPERPGLHQLADAIRFHVAANPVELTGDDRPSVTVENVYHDNRVVVSMPGEGDFEPGGYVGMILIAVDVHVEVDRLVAATNPDLIDEFQDGIANGPAAGFNSTWQIERNSDLLRQNLHLIRGSFYESHRPETIQAGPVIVCDGSESETE